MYAGMVTVASLSITSLAPVDVVNCSCVSAERLTLAPLSTLITLFALTLIVAPAGAVTLLLTVSVTLGASV